MSAEFKLGIPETASVDPSSDFLDLVATVVCRGYAGHTIFPLARRDLRAYIADVCAVRDGGAVASALVGGWEAAQERLRLRITPAGRSGQFQARINVATSGPRTDQWQRVETEFVCDPSALSSFIAAVEDLANGATRRDAVLVGDENAIA